MANKTLQLKIGNTTYRSSVDNTLTNEDLNNVTLPGLYNAGGGNSVTNKPSGIDHFGLLVIHRASGSYYIQIIYNDSKSYRRFCTNGTWSNWTEDKLTDTTYTSLKNPHALTLKINSASGIAYDGSSPITYDVTKTALGLNNVNNTADSAKSVKYAASAGSVAWGNVSGKPSTFPPASHEHDLSTMINKLSTGDSTPTDADYYVCQYAGGGTSMTSYHRRPVSALWSYIKSKTNSTYLPLSGGTMSGQIRSTNKGGSWISSRDNSIVRASSPSKDSYNPVVSQYTTAGEWSIGNLYGEESLTFSYTTDANYNSKNNTSTRVTIDKNGGAHFNAVYNAVYNDYAEFFPRGEATEPGDIVALDLTSDHESYIKATATSKIVAGVHSDEYAMLIGGDKVDDGNYVEKNLVNYIPVSLAGRVMCKVTGPVHRGDTIIVSGIPGVGIATDDENIPHKRVVGYVVEDDDRTDIRRVKIRVKG